MLAYQTELQPSAAKMAASQNKSASNSGIKSNPPVRLPYFSCRGSNMVVYLAFLTLGTYTRAAAMREKHTVSQHTTRTFLL